MLAGELFLESTKKRVLLYTKQEKVVIFVMQDYNSFAALPTYFLKE